MPMQPAEIAHQTRETIESWLAGSIGGLGLPSDKARGLCRLAASYLYFELQLAGYEPRLLCGTVYCDVVDPRLDSFLAAAGHLDAAHYWVVLGDDLYDISADQFNYRLHGGTFPRVLIGPVSTLERHHAMAESEPFVPTDRDWPTAFRRERTRVAVE